MMRLEWEFHSRLSFTFVAESTGLSANRPWGNMG
jgi:hypothetical protein